MSNLQVQLDNVSFAVQCIDDCTSVSFDGCVVMLWLLSVVYAESLLFSEERSTAFEDVVASVDERWVAFGTGSTGQIHLLDVDSWSLEVIDACNGAFGALTFDSTGYLYAGCEGSVFCKSIRRHWLLKLRLQWMRLGFTLRRCTMKTSTCWLKIQMVAIRGYIWWIYRCLLNKWQGSFNDVWVTVRQKIWRRLETFLWCLTVLRVSRRSIQYLEVPLGTSWVQPLVPVKMFYQQENGTNALISGGTAGVYRYLFANNQLQFASMGSGIEQATALVAHNDNLWVADSTADSLKSFTYNAGGASMGSEVLTEVSSRHQPKHSRDGQCARLHCGWY